MLIGLTGGIGAGKSTVSEYLIKKGYKVLDADKIAKKVLSSGSEALLQLVNDFGDDILHKDGSLNRKKVANIIFSDPIKKKRIEEITHGKIIEIILEDVSKLNDEKVIFVDAPLLYESNLNLHLDKVWVVDSGDEIRIQRVIKRDNLTREEIIKRMNNQISRKERLKKADHIIDNSMERTNLYKQVDKLLDEL